MATCLLLLIGKQTDCLDGHLYGIKGCYVLPDFYKYLYSFPEKDPVTSSPLWSILFLLWGQVHLFHIQHKEDTGKTEPFIYTPYMVRLSDLMGNFREQVKKEKLFTASASYKPQLQHILLPDCQTGIQDFPGNLSFQERNTFKCQ